jgi:hypothetical protein
MWKKHEVSIKTLNYFEVHAKFGAIPSKKY